MSVLRGEDYCGVVGKPCEHRHNMNNGDCIECRTMLILETIRNQKEVKK